MLETLLTIYSLILLANSIFSFYLWRVYQDDLYKISIIIWISTLLNFVLQGVFQNSDIKMLLSFSTYAATSYFLYSFTLLALDRHEKRQIWIGASLVLVLISHILLAAGVSYQIASAVSAVGIIVPMLRASYLIFNFPNQNLKAIKVLGIVLLLNSLHFLDYPILRFSPSGALIGFSIALSILFILSIFIPLFINDKNARNYSATLETEVVNKTKELSLISEDHKNFLIMVCHDLSSLMSILKFHSDKLLKNPQLDAATNEQSLKKMSQCISSSVAILQKVRELQRIKAGKEKIQLEPVNLYNCLSDTVNMYSSFLKDKNLQVEIKTNEISPIVFGDQVLLIHQVFGNIISNAIKFSEKNSSIQIGFYEKDNFIGVEIKDSGIGMPEEIRRNLFSFQSRTTRPGTSNEKGTGFGMPLVKTCVDLMGGKIKVQSVEKSTTSLTKSGSTFSVELKKTVAQQI